MNKEKMKTYKKAWYEANKEKRKLIQKARCYEANSDKIKAYLKANKERIKAWAEEKK